MDISGSDRHSVLNHPFANKWLNLAILWCLPPLPASACWHIQSVADGLSDHHPHFFHYFPSVGVGEVDGAARLVQGNG